MLTSLVCGISLIGLLSKKRAGVRDHVLLGLFDNAVIGSEFGIETTFSDNSTEFSDNGICCNFVAVESVETKRMREIIIQLMRLSVTE